VKNTCPVSKDRLTDLYWRERKTTKEIGILLAEAVDKSTSFDRGTVRKWMMIYGIPIRTKSQSSKLMHVQNPHIALAISESRKGVKAERISTPHLKAAAAKGRKAYSKNCKARRVHLVCAHPDCRKKYERRPSVAHQGKLNFCSYSCSTSYRHKARRERIALEKRFDALQQPSSPSPSAGYTFEEIARRERSE